LLSAINFVFRPDARFTQIRARKDRSEWEIFFDEEGKGTVALSSLGSGLKTVLLVMMNLHVVPTIEKKELRNYVFAFEELENNLHPALQRRLLRYLRNIAEKHNAVFFLSTHSTVALDMFSADPLAQVLHVGREGEATIVKTIRAYSDCRPLLDELEIRASDLLQSNGIVWVEGPSDRTYFRRWIDVWSEGQLVEGTHYQILFYGGKLLSHISCEEPNCDPSRVQVLTVNRNAIVLMDSDLRNEDGRKLSQTKQRILSELENAGGLGWVTAGKEVENYLPQAVMHEIFGADFPKVPPSTPLWNAIDRFKQGEGKKWEKQKVALSFSAGPLITREGLAGTLDLKERLDSVCATIRRWNGL
jgi:putative ATP-dependent endonuclease of OLD family